MGFGMGLGMMGAGVMGEGMIGMPVMKFGWRGRAMVLTTGMIQSYEELDKAVESFNTECQADPLQGEWERGERKGVWGMRMTE
jgi:hypothetical protein